MQGSFSASSEFPAGNEIVSDRPLLAAYALWTVPYFLAGRIGELRVRLSALSLQVSSTVPDLCLAANSFFFTVKPLHYSCTMEGEEHT